MTELAEGMPAVQSATQAAGSINIQAQNPLAVSVLARPRDNPPVQASAWFSNVIPRAMIPLAQSFFF